MTKTRIPSAIGRAALDSRRVRQELPDARRIAIRCRAVREMEFGEHWRSINGTEYFTAAGLRFLAKAHEREQDVAGARVCAGLADELDREERETGKSERTQEAEERESFAELERRGLA